MVRYSLRRRRWLQESVQLIITMETRQKSNILARKTGRKRQRQSHSGRTWPNLGCLAPRYLLVDGPFSSVLLPFVPVLLEKGPSTRRYLGTRQPRFGQVLPEWLYIPFVRFSCKSATHASKVCSLSKNPYLGVSTVGGSAVERT
jgi:hypothetical protein